MYLLIHTMTVVQTDCVLEAQFFHALQSNTPVRLVAKRFTVRFHASGGWHRNKLGAMPSLRTITKRKYSRVNHHLRTVKIVSQNRSNDFVQKIDECAKVESNPGLPITRKCPTEANIIKETSNVEENIKTITAESTDQETSKWLSFNRFTTYLQTFAGFSGADMLRMSREDLIQICGQADGIRLYNSLHSKSIAPKLTLYVCRENSNVFHAIYLTSHSNTELSQKLSTLLGVPREQIRNVYCQGPHGIHVIMNDDVIQHVKEESMYSVDVKMDSVAGIMIFLKPVVK